MHGTRQRAGGIRALRCQCVRLTGTAIYLELTGGRHGLQADRHGPQLAAGADRRGRQGTRGGGSAARGAEACKIPRLRRCAAGCRDGPRRTAAGQGRRVQRLRLVVLPSRPCLAANGLSGERDWALRIHADRSSPALGAMAESRGGAAWRRNALHRLRLRSQLPLQGPRRCQCRLRLHHPRGPRRRLQQALPPAACSPSSRASPAAAAHVRRRRCLAGQRIPLHPRICTAAVAIHPQHATRRVRGRIHEGLHLRPGAYPLARVAGSQVEPHPRSLHLG